MSFTPDTQEEPVTAMVYSYGYRLERKALYVHQSAVLCTYMMLQCTETTVFMYILRLVYTCFVILCIFDRRATDSTCITLSTLPFNDLSKKSCINAVLI